MTKMSDDVKQPICNDRAAALQAGVDIFCDAMEQVSQYLRRNRNEKTVGAVNDVITLLDEGLDGVVQAIEAVDESGEMIKHQIGNVAFALEKMAETKDWVDTQFPVADSVENESAFYWAGSVNNVFTGAGNAAGFGNVVSSFNELMR